MRKLNAEVMNLAAGVINQTKRVVFMAKLTKRADGRYYVQVLIGRDKSGKKKYKSVYGATQKEAQRKADELRAALGKGIDISAQRDTFRQWRERWIASKTCGAGQLTAYKANINHLSELDYMEIGKIRTSDIQSIFTRLSHELSRKTLTQIRMAARQVFQLAIVDRVLDYNPVDAVTIPKAATAPETREALTDEQIEWIRTTPSPRAQLPAMIMLYCGLRRGELMALRWSDIDLKDKVIHVRRSVEMVNGKPVEKEGGKTDAATRDVPIPDVLYTFLVSAQPTAKKRSINLYPLITEKARGGLHTSKSWAELWSSYMDDINIAHGDFSDCIDSDGRRYTPTSKHDPRGVPCRIETFTPHQLRHTYATLLYEAGVDVMTAQKLLGHASPSTTLNIYTHLRDKHKAAEITKLNDYLNGQSEGADKSKTSQN